MRVYVVVYITVGLLILLAKTADAAAPALEDRLRLAEALQKQGVLNPERRLVHISHTCSLRIDGRMFPVVDVRELVKGAVVPRGVNHIIVLDPSLKPVQMIEYTSERPLFCLDNKLFLFGDILIGNVMPEGNVLTFSHNGTQISLEHIETNDWPIPVTKTAHLPIQ